MTLTGWRITMARLVAPAFLLAVPYIAGIAAARRLEARRASFIGIAEVFLTVLYEWPLLG